MDFRYVFSLFKWLLIGAVILAAYMAYIVYFKVWLIRRKYRKYKNIGMTKELVLGMGDCGQYVKDDKEGKVIYDTFYKESEERDKYDLFLFLEGIFPFIRIQSPEAHRQFEELVKAKIIDRYTDKSGFGKFAYIGLGNIKSTNDFENRRKIFTKLLGLNSSSRYIPLIINCTKQIMKEWKIGGTYQMINQMNKLTFSIITLVLFGGDMTNISTKLIDYENDKGEFTKMEARDYFIQILKDMFNSYFHPIKLFFPFTSDYSLINPFKRLQKNINRFKNSLSEELKKSKDEGSICSLISSHDNISKEAILDDLITFIIGGTETSAHLITSCIYYLMKNEDTLKKLKMEIESFGISKNESTENLFTRENLQQMDYLNYVIKETLRLDDPVYESLNYCAVQDIQICGVPIPKDTKLRVDFTCRHLNSRDWQQPMKFIPERFDPTSEYFDNPSGESKTKTPFSFIPFSHGMRNCPGQIFALLQTKVILLYLLTRTEFTLDPEIMKKESMGFNLLTKFDLPFTIVKS